MCVRLLYTKLEGDGPERGVEPLPLCFHRFGSRSMWLMWPQDGWASTQPKELFWFVAKLMKPKKGGSCFLKMQKTHHCYKALWGWNTLWFHLCGFPFFEAIFFAYFYLRSCGFKVKSRAFPNWQSSESRSEAEAYIRILYNVIMSIRQIPIST